MSIEGDEGGECPKLDITYENIKKLIFDYRKIHFINIDYALNIKEYISGEFCYAKVKSVSSELTIDRFSVSQTNQYDGKWIGFGLFMCASYTPNLAYRISSPYLNRLITGRKSLKLANFEDKDHSYKEIFAKN